MKNLHLFFVENFYFICLRIACIAEFSQHVIFGLVINSVNKKPDKFNPIFTEKILFLLICVETDYHTK